MLRLVGLDSGPLGLLTHPKPSETAQACIRWLGALLVADVAVVLPSIAHYELRREYLLRDNTVSLEKLETLREVLDISAMNDAVLDEAAQLWAKVRRGGQPTAGSKALDIDCLVATQIRIFAREMGVSETEWMVATTDVGDLPRLAPAAHWPDISLSSP